MKRIDNSDVNIKLESKLVYLQNFNAKFYTVNPQSFFIRKTQDDVFTAETCTGVADYYIKLDWSDLVTMGKGVLQYQITNNIPDEDRADLEYNSLLERTTEYYVNSDVTVDPETESSITEVIAELEEKIDAEITRSTSADTVHEVAIQDEVITRQQNVSDLTDLITGETNRAISAETAIDDKFDNVYTKSEVYNKSEIDTIIENIDVSDQLVNYTPLSSFTAFSGDVTFQYNALNDKINQEALDRELIDTSLSRRINNKLDASAYTPTDLTSYYTKSETDNLVDAETTRATNAESALSTSIESKYEKPSGGIPKSDLASSVQTSLGLADTALQSFTETDPTVPSWAKAQNKPTYTADEINDATTTNKFVTEQEKTIWNNKSNFSGSYNDLTNKPTIPTALSQLSEDSTHRVVTDAEKTTWNNKQDTLVSGTNIKTINNQSIIGSGNIEIQGGGSFDPTQYYTKQETDDLLAAIEMGQIGYIDAGDYA